MRLIGRTRMDNGLLKLPEDLLENKVSAVHSGGRVGETQGIALVNNAYERLSNLVDLAWSETVSQEFRSYGQVSGLGNRKDRCQFEFIQLFGSPIEALALLIEDFELLIESKMPSTENDGLRKICWL